jgi:hypothetical protein
MALTFSFPAFECSGLLNGTSRYQPEEGEREDMHTNRHDTEEHRYRDERYNVYLRYEL